MREKLTITEGIFPVPFLMVATHNENGNLIIKIASPFVGTASFKKREAAAPHSAAATKQVGGLLSR